ncbi:hypothetical protein BDAP_000876 [Binucleata daphniae]
MDLPVFPIFDIKVVDEFVIASGGGGDPLFGKKNGVVVYDLTTYKGICFCETDDVIEKIKICDQSSKFGADLDDKKKMKEGFSCDSDEITEKYDEDTKKSDVEDGKNEVNKHDILEGNRHNVNETDNDNVKNNKILGANDKTLVANENNVAVNGKTYFIIACGLKNFYYITLHKNEMKLIQKIEGRVDCCYYNEILLFTYKSHLYGICDRNKIQIYDKPKYKHSIYQSNTKFDQNHEEYLYSIKKDDYKISFHREDLSEDIPENWVSFFVVKNYVYKVLKQESNYVFVFQGIKYKFEHEVCEPYYNHKLEELVFYLRGEKSQVCFYRRNYKKCVFIDRITALNVDNNIVSVADSDGRVFIFDEQRNYVIKKVYDLPITGCAVKDNYVYFCSFNGLIDRKKIRTNKFYFVLFALSVIFSILLYFVTRNKKVE